MEYFPAAKKNELHLSINTQKQCWVRKGSYRICKCYYGYLYKY